MKSYRNSTARQAGFTLIEAMVVIAIIGIISLAAVVNMIGWRTERQMQGAARGFLADMQRARITAIREGEAVSVLMNPGAGGSYQVFLDTNEDYILDAGETQITNVTIPVAITMQNVTFPTNRTQFNSRGMAANAGRCQFTTADGDNLTVEANSVGNIWVQ
jgi:type IV fimbrial biogenesis protein FimT